ncbi:ABC transporter permease [Anaerobium acetethylicum]|uniref:Sodium transport system permease protein n=1 Tax=Anaerobium acetethylicum TaxID=1619234 RepID=A0A1D3TV97_9FIRM|nr:ABC transporter permease [Anaerobium acetethylicum]SCP98046.1 sodium transport system permease protein [Anaerobium acetethylicum]
MKGIGYIMKKELTRVFSDKKLVLSLFVFPVALIIGMYALIGNLTANAEENVNAHEPAVYIQNSPDDFREILESVKGAGDLKFMDAGDDLEVAKEEIRQGIAELIIVFDEGFAEAVQDYKTGDAIPQIRTFYNPSEEYSEAARSFYLNGIIEPYRQTILAGRIGDVERITVFTIDSDNPDMMIQDEEKATGKMLGSMLPYFITLILFAGAMNLGIDAITGEKERGTMASMLISPINRSSIVLGKVFSLMILCGLSAAIYVISMVLALPHISTTFGGGDILEGMTIRFTPVQIIEMICIVVVLVFLYVAIISLAAVFAKTVKEGTAYVTPIYIFVLGAGMVTMFNQGDSALYYYMIPLYNSSIALRDLFARDLSLLEFAITFISTLAAGGILTAVIVKAFNSEKVMMNA